MKTVDQASNTIELDEIEVSLIPVIDMLILLEERWNELENEAVQSEIVWWYCRKCEEEYRFPEDIEECLICNSYDIELV